MGGVCQIWAPIYYGTVMKYVANNFSMMFFWSLSVLSIWAGFVICGWDLSHAGLCHMLMGFVTVCDEYSYLYSYSQISVRIFIFVFVY